MRLRIVPVKKLGARLAKAVDGAVMKVDLKARLHLHNLWQSLLASWRVMWSGSWCLPD